MEFRRDVEKKINYTVIVFCYLGDCKEKFILDRYTGTLLRFRNIEQY